MIDLHKELEIGRSIARQAGEIALRYYRTGIAFEAKPDDSPVTLADRECEQFIARELERAFPDDGLLGEEGAQKPSRSGRRWIIDPIDGTRDFVRGNPVWANLIGLEADGEVVAGFAYMPALGELFAATRGGGAFVNAERMHASRHRQRQPGRAVLRQPELRGAPAVRRPTARLDGSLLGRAQHGRMFGCHDGRARPRRNLD